MNSKLEMIAEISRLYDEIEELKSRVPKTVDKSGVMTDIGREYVFESLFKSWKFQSMRPSIVAKEPVRFLSFDEWRSEINRSQFQDYVLEKWETKMGVTLEGILAEFESELRSLYEEVLTQLVRMRS